MYLGRLEKGAQQPPMATVGWDKNVYIRHGTFMQMKGCVCTKQRSPLCELKDSICINYISFAGSPWELVSGWPAENASRSSLRLVIGKKERKNLVHTVPKSHG